MSECQDSSSTGVHHLRGSGLLGATSRRFGTSIPLDEAIQALRRDLTHPVLVKVDERLNVEVRAVDPVQAPKKTMGDLLREVGRWEGESGAELDALSIRQRGNRHPLVPLRYFSTA